MVFLWLRRAYQALFLGLFVYLVLVTTMSLIGGHPVEWFLGFDPRLAAGVWIGFDQKRSLGEKETGSRAALPAWLGFMEKVLADRPVEDFPIPSNIVFVPVDKHTGYPAHGSSKDVILEAFIAGTEPAGYSRSN